MWAKFLAWIDSFFEQISSPPSLPIPKPNPSADYFDAAFSYTVGNEGGYSNDAADSGGPTKFGITQYDLSQWNGHPASVQEVKDMPLATAKAIYRKHYWDSLSLGLIVDQGVAECMFDIGVVRGIGVPPKYAQLICHNHGAGLVKDGHLGPKTIAAINMIDPSIFIREFEADVEAGFQSIVANKPTQRVFLKGWLNRAKRLLSLIKKSFVG